MLASLLPPFLDTYILLMSSFVRRALFIVINFLVFWFVCLNSSFVHFKNCLEYRTRWTVQELIPSIRFLLQRLISRGFLVLLWYYFPTFLFSFDGIRVQYSQVIVIFFFFKYFNAFLIW